MLFNDALEQVMMAENLGYESVWLGEHHGFDNYWPSPQIALAAFAARTTKVRLGTNILILPLANPIRLAGEWALLDQISDGRVTLGVGMGWSREEFQALDVPYERRGVRLEEYVVLLKRLWTEENVSFDESTYQLENFTLTPRPVQKPHPPIWIGGRSPRNIARAARLGDAWVPDAAASIDELASAKTVYDEALRVEGREAEIKERPTTRHVILGKTNAEAWERAKPYFEGAYALHLKRGNPLVASAYSSNLEEFVRGRYIVGDAEACADEIIGMREILGITNLAVKFAARITPHEAADDMRLFAEKVVPRVG